jgi:hypothetical protein
MVAAKRAVSNIRRRTFRGKLVSVQEILSLRIIGLNQIETERLKALIVQSMIDSIGVRTFLFGVNQEFFEGASW